MAKGGSATGPKRVRFDAHKIAKKLKQHKKLSNIGSPSAGFLEHELEGGTNNAGICPFRPGPVAWSLERAGFVARAQHAARHALVFKGSSPYVRFF